jgi:hypothetical protein
MGEVSTICHRQMRIPRFNRRKIKHRFPLPPLQKASLYPPLADISASRNALAEVKDIFFIIRKIINDRKSPSKTR